MITDPNQLPELEGYRPVAAVQFRGPLATCLVKSADTHLVRLAEWLEVTETSPEAFARLRRCWQRNVQRQPAGSLAQHQLYESDRRLTRVIDIPRGRALREWIFNGRFDVIESLETAIALAECLADWHQMSRVHGWLGGESIFRDSESGIELRDASVFDVHFEQDILSMPVRDVVFLSPESSGSLSRDLSPASDMYSVGVVLFGMLAGRPPIEACTASDYLDRQLCVEAPHLRELGLEVPPPLDDLVARLLRRDPRDRYETANGLLFDLRHILSCEQNPDQHELFVIGTQDVRRTLTEAALVGRESEIESLQRWIVEAQSGHSRIQLITGVEASCRRNLMTEVSLRAQARGLFVFRGGASTSSSSKPLQSLEAILAAVASVCHDDSMLAARIASATREHAVTLTKLLPSLSPLWPVVDEQGGPEAYGGRRAAIALEELFAAFAKEPQGTAFIFDEFELADELTQTVIRALAERFKKERGHLILCVGTAAVPASLNVATNVPTIRLAAVSGAALQLHLQSTAGKLSEPIVQSILSVADGSTMMASAILGRMIDTRAVTPSDDGWISHGPLIEALRGDESFAELLERQIGSLSEMALRILSSAAVIGQRFDLGMLADVTEVRYAEVLEVATDALGRRLLWRDERPGWFCFAQDQIREQLCAGLKSSQRRELHLKAAAYLEKHDPGNVFDLAYHYDAAGEAEPALERSLHAARLARHRFSLSVARNQLEIAKRWVSQCNQETALEIYEGLGEIHLLAGQYEQADVCLREALTLAQTPLEQARVQQQIGELAFKRGQFAEAAAEYEHALSITGIRLPGNFFTMLCGLVAQTFYQAIHTCLPAEWIAQARQPSELECLRLQLLSRLSRIYWFTRHKLWTLSNHLRSLNEAERFAPSATLAAVYSEHGPVMSLLRWFSRANHYAERSLAIRRAQGDIWGQGQTHHYHCVVMLAECRFEESYETSMRAVEMLRQTGDVWEMNMARYQAANALYRLGRLADATALASEMYVSGREIGDLQATGISLDVWARAIPQTLPLETVAEEAWRFRPDAQSHAQTQLAYAIILLHHQRIDEAIETLRDAIDRCTKAGHLNAYISPCYAWLGTALRRQIEATKCYEGRLIRQRIRNTRRVMRRASRIARGFPADRAHCFREIAMLHGIRGNVWRSQRYLKKSVLAAEKLSQSVEELESLQLLQSLHHRESALLGPMPAAFQARLAELTDSQEYPSRREPAPEATGTSLSLADRFVTVLKSGRRIAQSLSASAVYTEASESARRLLRGQHVDVVMVDGIGDERVLSAWADGNVDDSCPARIKANEHVIQLAIRQGKTVCRGGVRSDAATEAASAIAAPIAFRGKPVAVILVTHYELRELFGSDEVRIADFVASLAGAALENADGFLRLQQMNDTLEQRVLERTQAAEERARQLAISNRQLRTTEEQLREAIVQANSANEAKGRFLATISHEIRTPLNGILGMTRLAQQNRADQRQMGYLDAVQESGRSLLTLINDLLDFSKLEAGKMELERIPLDPRQLAGEVARMLAVSAWQKGVELVCDVDPEVPQVVVGDPSRLRQIIVNLIGNAVKFTERGFITLAIRTTSDHRLVIAVRDSGIGIPEGNLEKVFESFSQADSSTTRRYGGTGLGLAICRELTEMMGGVIEVKSEVGVGSTFTVLLPLEGATAPPERRPSLSHRRVALIEPLTAARQALATALRAAGATVEEYERLADSSDPMLARGWDLVVLGGGGTDPAAMRIVAACEEHGIPCLLLTHPNAARCVEGGPGVVELAKPVQATELIGAAEWLLDHASHSAAMAPPAATDHTLLTELHPITSAKEVEAPRPRATRILVAEDGVINQEVIVGILELKGYEVVIANDGEQAVERAMNDRFDLCLMDVDMPKMDGIEATRHIRADSPYQLGKCLPIIAMTAHTGDLIWDSCKAAGMDAYLAKPIQPDTLFEIIEHFTSREIESLDEPAVVAVEPAPVPSCQIALRR